MSSPGIPRFTPRRKGISGTFRTLGGFRLHAPSLAVFAVGALSGWVAFAWLRQRATDRVSAAFHDEASLVAADLRSALERPLEILEASGALFEASREVSRAEFARFVKPALERHPGVRALEWIPIVPNQERARYEAAAREDGLLGFEFRQHDTGADSARMVRASERDEYLPIYYMEPGHPLVLGFDCASDSERRSIVERARASGSTVASLRIRLLDDPPSVYSVVVFRPVYDVTKPRSPSAVRGFTCEVFRIRAVAERAIEQSARRGIAVSLIDPSAPRDKQALFESDADTAAAQSGTSTGLRYDTTLRYADRDWRLILRAARGYRRDLQGSAWVALLGGCLGGALLGACVSTFRVIRRLRGQVRAAQRLGQYTLLEKLGEGGVGVVHKAQHAMLRRPTAIKFLAQTSDDARTLARFEREVQLTSELTHPNTISIYDYGRTPEGVFYYAMEYIDGVTLEQLVAKTGPLAAGRVLRLLKQVCQSLSEAHRAGLIHRDIKPSNLMVCTRGGVADFVKVMDFGLVKDLGGTPVADAVTESATATIVGTPLYMAPEAISKPAEVDARADVYAVGAVAYFLLVGAPVFEGQTVVEVCMQHMIAEPIPPSERGAKVPASLERIVLQCLKKDPAQRYVDAGELFAAFDAIDDVESWSAPATLAYLV